MMAYGWEDPELDYPLTFKFGYVKNDVFTSFYDGFENVASRTYPSGSVTTRVYICDSEDLCSHVDKVLVIES
jgi:hypothetical protein